MSNSLSPKALRRIHQLEQIEAAISEEKTIGVDIYPLQSMYEKMKTVHEKLLVIEEKYFELTGRHLGDS
jgi:hypothetical protein